MQDPETMTNSALLKELCGVEAELDALDSGLGRQPRAVQVLNKRIHSLRTALLLRMGGGEIKPADETLVMELAKVYADAVNSGEDKPPEVREAIKQLTAQVLTIASRDQVLQLT